MLTTIYYEREGDINGRKKKAKTASQKKACHASWSWLFILSFRKLWGLTRISALWMCKVLGYGGLALGGVLLNVLLCTASVELSHIAAYGTLYQCKINYVSHITKLPLDYH